jgi:DNA-binding MarR family transcriptional regulator
MAVSLLWIDGCRSGEHQGRFVTTRSGPQIFHRLRVPDDHSLQSCRFLCRLSSMAPRDSNVRVSLQTLRVLEAFLENPSDQLSGADVLKRTGVPSGTLYPILLRLEAAGWFKSRWEAIDPATAGRPRRRLYRLTPSGLQLATNVAASFTFRRGLPA